MRIVFFTGSMRKGGAERVLSILSREYADNGYEVMICPLLSEKLDYKLNESVIFNPINRKRKHRLSNLFFWRKSIKSVIKEYKPDVVVSFFTKINLIVLSLIGIIRKNKIKLIISERNNPYVIIGFFEKILTNLLYPKADSIVFQTNQAKNFFNKRVQKKSIIIGNPLNRVVVQYKGGSDIISIGRFEEQKNHVILIKAYNILFNKGFRNKLVLYGAGPLKSELQKLSVSLQLENHIIFGGIVDNVQEVLTKSKLFVMPSKYEGLSNALLEAMQCGIPIVGSNTIGINSIIENGVNGYLFINNDVEDLAKVMMHSLENIENSIFMAAKAKEYINTFYFEETIKSWFKILH